MYLALVLLETSCDSFTNTETDKALVGEAPLSDRWVDVHAVVGERGSRLDTGVVTDSAPHWHAVRR